MSTTTENGILRGLQTVRVNKDELLKRIKKNRADHRQIYEEAMDGWKKAVIDELEKMHADALKGKDFRLAVRLERPEDHTDEYDTIIELLEMSLDDELELPYNEFANYALDKWGWQGRFLSMSASYGSTGALAKTSS